MAHRVSVIKYGIILVVAASWLTAAWLVHPTRAQQSPSGSAVLNQGLYSGAITPSDTQALPVITRALYNGNGTACNIAMKLARDAVAVTWLNVQPGEFLPVSTTQIMNTNTTCANIVGIW